MTQSFSFPSGRTKSRLQAVVLLLLAALCLAPALAASPARVVAVGDVHGDYDALVGILQRAALLDSKLRWSGGKATLVMTGDLLDRGPRDRDVLDLLMQLEKQAPKKGGRVIVVLGNHEVMNLVGDLRYVSAESFAGFAGSDPEKQRRNALRDHLDWDKSRARNAGDLPASGPTPEERWLAAHPPGFAEHRQAFAPDGKYGRWLRERPAVARVGDAIFLHGGISPQLASQSLDAINQRVREELAAMDRSRDHFVQQRLIPPLANLQETMDLIRAERDARKARMDELTAQAAAEGKTYQPSEEEQKSFATLERFLESGSWYIMHSDGPLWFRGYDKWTEEEGEAHTAELLARLSAKHIVVGHTPQDGGRIRSRFGGRVLLIDTGMLSGYYQGGRASALEIAAETFTAIYPDQRIVLQPTAGPLPRPANPEKPGQEASGGSLSAEFLPPQSPRPALPASDPAAIERTWLGPDGRPLPFRNDAEVLDFLQHAKVVSMREIGQGITNPQRVELERNGVRARAVFREVNEEKSGGAMSGGVAELFFRDSFIFEPAAYHLGLMLGLDSVPPAILRTIHGREGSLQLWLEQARRYTDTRNEKLDPPDPVQWSKQIHVMRVFDNLIYNTDRNTGNMLIDSEWRLWLIDHTRAFRRQVDLRTPDMVIQCSLPLYESLKTLDESAVKQRLKPFLRGYELESLFVRRRKLLKHLDKLIQERGEQLVLFGQE